MSARVFSSNLPQLLWLNSTLRYSFQENFLSLCFCRFQRNSMYMHHCSHANLLFSLPLCFPFECVCACVSDANFKDASCHCSNDALISWNWPKYNRNFHSSESVPISLECIAVHCTWAHTHTHSHLDDMCKVCCACFMDAKWMLSKNETTECDAMQCRVWVCRWMNLVSQYKVV